jgi:hypothetical protein
MALVAVVAALRAAGHVVATEVTNGVTKQWFFRSRPS